MAVRNRGLVLLLLGLLAAPVARAEAPAWDTLSLRTMLLAAHNPLGAELRLRLGYQRLLTDSQELLLKDTFVFVGVRPRLNPAYAGVGPSVEVQPLAVLHLHLQAEWVQLFGGFGLVQSFASPRAEYAGAVLDAGQARGDAYGTSGLHLLVEPTLQVKVGPVALQNKLSLHRWQVGLRAGTRVWWEGEADTLVPGDGWVLINELNLAYLGAEPWTLGLQYRAVQPLYEARHFPAGEAAAWGANGHHRVGPVVAYTFHRAEHPLFRRPTLFGLAGWFLSHRYRAGAQGSALVPALLVGLGFETDLLPGGAR